MLETEITTGTLVVHPGKPEFGPGKVAHVRGQMLHVFFRDRSDRRALKYNRESLRPAAVQSDPVLDNLPPCLEKAGAFWLPADRMTLLMARERFLEFFPGGFSDPEYLGQSANERKYKWEAHERLVGVFGDDRARAMLADGRALELAGEALRALGGAANLLAKTEVIALTEGLRDEAAAEGFLSTLIDLLEAGPVEPAFNAHAEAAASLPAKGATHTAKWPVVTIFPYLVRPDTFMFVKPDSTKAAAAALAFDIRYDVAPNWDTYERVQHMAHIYMQQLADMGPRDFIDIQSFFWVTGGTYAATLAKQARKKRQKAG